MFQGSIVALITPMTSDGTIDYPAYESLIAWHLENATDGFVVLGTTGESPTISAEERQQLIKTTLACVNKQKPVIVGTGANATDQTVALTQEAKDLGADGVLVVTPYYNKPVQEGLYQHFKKVAESVAIPQILYNVPSRTGCDLIPETVARLDKVENIVAIKEATGQVERLSLFKSLGVTMTLLSGDDASAQCFMKLGGKGVITVAANAVPRLFREMIAAGLAGDHDRAFALDNHMRDLYQALGVESNPIPIKYALQRMGKIQDGIRLPLTALSVGHRTAVDAALDVLQALKLEEV